LSPENGNQMGYNSVDILDLYLDNSMTPATEDDLAQILAFQFNIVGPINGEQTFFSSGAGTITYSASNELTVQTGLPGGLDSDWYTLETGNSVYGTLPQGQSKTFTQWFITVDPADPAELSSYGDAGTPGNVSDPVVVGFGGWLDFKFLFGGENVSGENRIYAVVA
jgi:hypothetical protein